ncbi:monovalent cation/H+ antiporter subunit D [Denitratisoma oestradiolicum]|uniref:Putative K(+)/H(+) antiporter subunit D n=1 Tax=Denitratisoma oestradiolicum TaxID=311182 RepID=A0A6S6XS24_9PROT|nr:monovalent cation/H+ antiporter subunit D [Denitratisoma oestradiolicum]TWO81897.1 monovalent cation/H+ antiporter subunit D [Denitratisoma oestradiolicum]CAB1368786.1 putative K(+)/H(+) antiporter subunit D [Denitratisoma oestradiolicum]
MIQHLPILPILLPLLTGALLLFSGEARHGWRALFALCATLAQLAVALALLASTDGWIATPWRDGVVVYALGNWAAPFGIVLVVDRLAALMLTLTAILGLAALVYALARWERAGSHFLPLFQFLLMGLSGAFLTGDLFNLFVFFEVLLAASYGLALHASGTPRVMAGLHYIVINLVASLVFLVAAALIYGVTGTLNMAELAVAVARLDADARALFEIGALLLGIVFLVKAGAWPLNFWLPAAYAAATPPVGAVFAILTKVGVYALLRFSILFGQDVAPAPFKGDWLFFGGLATILVGTLGVLAAQKLDRLAGFMVVVSSGTLLAAFGFTGTTLTAPALYYLASSVLGSGAFFMLIEMAERNRAASADFLAISSEAFGLQERHESEHPDEMAGVAIPAAMAFLGLAFFSCAAILSGLPPLSGFVAKFALLKATIAAPPLASAPHAGLMFAALLLSGLAGLIALSRLGIRVFWDSERPTPRLQWLEAGPVAGLVLLCFALAFGAGPAMAYFEAAARALHDPATYISIVLPGGRP